jgi:transcriptional regulator with XRE-family HTH domain
VLDELKQTADLPQGEVAKRTNTSQVSLSRYAAGERRPPPALYRKLSELRQAARVPASLALAAEHEAWLAAKRGRGPVFTFSCSLPRGMSPEAAVAACESAVRELAAGARR